MIAELQVKVVAGQEVQVTTAHARDDGTESLGDIEFADAAAGDVRVGHDDALEGKVGTVVLEVVVEDLADEGCRLLNRRGIADHDDVITRQQVLAGSGDAGTPVTTQVGQAHALVAPRVDVARVDVLGDMNTHGLQGRPREGRRVLRADPLPRHGDRDDEDAADDTHRIAEGVSDRRVRVPREAGGRIEGGSGRQRTREEARGQTRRQAEEATTNEGNERAHDTHDCREGEEVRLLTQILEEGRARGNADAIDKERQTHRLDDRHVVTDDLRVEGRNDETDEESTRRTEAQRADPNGPDRRTQRNDDKQCEQG